MSRLRRACCAVLAFLFHANAFAMSCPPFASAGFPHGDFKRLPANAKGILFVQARGGDFVHVGGGESSIIVLRDSDSLKPEQFLIRSSGKTHPAKLTPVELPPGALQRHIRQYEFINKADELNYLKRKEKGGDLEVDERKLRRVPFWKMVLIAPANGLKSGDHYTIDFVGRDFGTSYTHDTRVEFVVDTKPLFISDAYRIELDGDNAIQIDEPLMDPWKTYFLAQHYRHIFPEAIKSYAGHLTVLDEEDVPGRPGAFFGFEPFDCGVRFGRNLSLDSRGELLQPCEGAPIKRQVRSWIGLPEVDGKLHLAAPVAIDFSRMDGMLCKSRRWLDGLRDR